MGLPQVRTGVAQCGDNVLAVITVLLVVSTFSQAPGSVLAGRPLSLHAVRSRVDIPAAPSTWNVPWDQADSTRRPCFRDAGPDEHLAGPQGTGLVRGPVPGARTEDCLGPSGTESGRLEIARRRPSQRPLLVDPRARRNASCSIAYRVHRGRPLPYGTVLSFRQKTMQPVRRGARTTHRHEGYWSDELSSRRRFECRLQGGSNCISAPGWVLFSAVSAAPLRRGRVAPVGFRTVPAPRACASLMSRHSASYLRIGEG